MQLLNVFADALQQDASESHAVCLIKTMESIKMSNVDLTVINNFNIQVMIIIIFNNLFPGHNCLIQHC